MNLLMTKATHPELLFDAQNKAHLVIFLFRASNSQVPLLPGDTLGFHASEA